MFWFVRRLPSEMRTASPLTSHSKVNNAGKEILAEQTTVSTHSNTEDRQPLSVQPQQMDNVMDSSDTTGGYLVWLSHHNYIHNNYYNSAAKLLCSFCVDAPSGLL